MRRNRSKIGLCGPKNVHDRGDGISYFVTEDSTDLFSIPFKDKEFPMDSVVVNFVWFIR